MFLKQGLLKILGWLIGRSIGRFERGRKKILTAEVAELQHAEDAEKSVYHRGHRGAQRLVNIFGSR